MRELWYAIFVGIRMRFRIAIGVRAVVEHWKSAMACENRKRSMPTTFCENFFCGTNHIEKRYFHELVIGIKTFENLLNILKSKWFSK